MSVVAEFFQNEFNEYVASTLVKTFAAKKAAYLTFNIFNVKYDPDEDSVIVEDELDPCRVETIPFSEFVNLVELHSAVATPTTHRRHPVVPRDRSY